MTKRSSKKVGSAFKITNPAFKSRNKSTFTIGDQPLKNIQVLEGIDSYSDVTLMVCSTAVVITLLSQVSTTRAGTGYTGNVDISETFKFWKSRFLKTDNVLVCVASLALVASISFAPIDPDALENELAMLIDCYPGSRPFIKNLNAKNVERWRHGYMSRMLGWINSCPATSITAFSLEPRTVGSMTIQQVIDSIGLKNPPDAITVAKYIISVVAAEHEREFVFNEPPLSDDANCTAIELELLTQGLEFTRAVQTVSDTPKPRASEFSRETLTQYLTPRELLYYDNAVKIANVDYIKAAHEKVRVALGSTPDLSPEARALLKRPEDAMNRLKGAARKPGDRRTKKQSDAEGGASA